MLMEGAALVGPARDVLQYPAAACPELLLITISETRTTWNLLQRDVFAALLPQHITNAAQVATGPTLPAGKARSRELLTRVWSAAPPEVLLDLLIELYMQDPATTTPRIARVCMELGVLPQVLGSLPVGVSLEVAAYAGGAGMLNLEAWLGDYCNRDVMSVMSAMMRLVLDKADPQPQPPGPDGQPGAPRGGGPPLAAEAARAILKVLQASAQAGLPVDLVHEMKVSERGCSALVSEAAGWLLSVGGRRYAGLSGDGRGV